MARYFTLLYLKETTKDSSSYSKMALHIASMKQRCHHGTLWSFVTRK